MKRRSFVSAVSALPLALVSPLTVVGYVGRVCAEEVPTSAAAPKRPKRAILVTGGGYSRYQNILKATVRGLARLNVIQDGSVEIPEGSSSTEEMWSWLADEAGGNRLVFLSDGHYSYEWSPEDRVAVRAEVLRRLRERKDVDIIFTLGTEASEDMRGAVDDLPVISLGSSDPVATGLVLSAEDSGKDNFHALVTSDYFDWQLERFYAIFHFKRLGLLAADVRRKKCGADDARAFCAKYGIELVEVYYEEKGDDPQGDYQRLYAGLLKLVDARIDALCLPYFLCPNECFPEFLEVLTSRGIPSFTQEGHEVVSRGILLGNDRTDVESYGLTEARVIDRVLKGEKPRSIDLHVAQCQKLLINLKTAMQMGWQPPLGLLVSVEETYSTHSPSDQ